LGANAGGNVKVNGTNLLVPLAGYPDNIQAGHCILNEIGWSIYSVNWRVDCFDLSPYNGQTIFLTFDFGSSIISQPNPGWYLSRVALGEYNPTSVDETETAPDIFYLRQNYPNPGRSETQISFDLPRATHVSLRVYDLSGRLVATLADETMSPGAHAVSWNGRDDAGVHVGSGIYFYRLEAGRQVQTKRMVILR
jgi:hypothetical protein